MDKRANKTIFQRLNNLFGPEGVNVPKEQTNRYSIGDGELLRTDNKEEFELAKKQALQNAYLSNQWQKVDNEMYQQSIHYETTRIGAYSDFEAMEFYPEIAAALDIMMEEATTPNNKGKLVNVYSDSERVKNIIEDLLFNRLDIHTTLPMWTRNTCKYGDNFVYLNIDDKAGIIGGRQMPNFEMERREGDLINALIYNNNLKSSNKKGDDYDNKVKFFWKGKGVEFNSWQIAHFRLLGDDRKLPYGTSVLEKARRIWKQLLLSEDAMLIYRVTRAPERRVYKVYVGNIDDKDVPAYVNQIANRFKRAPVIDPQTGQIDLRYNQLAYDQDFFIPVRTENAQTPIDTLAGASNLDQIADIEYLQRKLFTALRVPKTFLGFDEPTGEGKNLALQDIRFSRTVNRIQQAMIMELNKIVIIHLYLLGFEDDLDNFTLTLNNPSTQAEMLKLEHLQQKISLYAEAVRDAGNGFAPMSMTRAKREILGMTNDEIKQDLLEQRIEKAAAAELEATSKVIKHTGFFDKVDNIYGIPEEEREAGGGDEEAGAEGEGGGEAGGGGGFAGGGGFGGEELDFGEEETPPEEAGAEGEGGGEAGAEGEAGGETFGGEEPESFGGGTEKKPAGAEESFIRKTNKILTEQKSMVKRKLESRQNRYRDIFMDKLLLSIRDEEKPMTNVKIQDKTLRVNESVEDMINQIDKMIGE